MAWEENSCISLNMQLIAILSRIGVFLVSKGNFMVSFTLDVVKFLLIYRHL